MHLEFKMCLRDLALAAIASLPFVAVTSTAGAFDVTRFAQDGDGSVNTWMLEGDEGVVLIDTQRSLSAGGKAAEAVLAQSRPLLAILLTHPHPDHFGGLASLLEVFPSVPVYASAETLSIMERDANGFIALTRSVLGDDAPEEQPLPSETFQDEQDLRFGDIHLVVDEIGRGEADTMTMFYAPDENYLFTGDVVDNGMTPFLMEGHTLDWLAQLEEIRSAYSDRNPIVFPGHGERGDLALFDAQSDLLSWLHDQVRSGLVDGITEAEIEEIASAYDARYPNHPPVAAVPNLMVENIRAVARELEGP